MIYVAMEGTVPSLSAGPAEGLRPLKILQVLIEAKLRIKLPC